MILLSTFLALCAVQIAQAESECDPRPDYKGSVMLKEFQGHGTTRSCLMKHPNDQKPYVLRLGYIDESEYCAMKMAADNGISPEIYFVSDDRLCTAMAYIDGNTLSAQAAKSPHTIACLANTIRQAHIATKNLCSACDGSLKTRQENFYAELCGRLQSSKECLSCLDKAMKLWTDSYEQLDLLSDTFVHIHGDLNMRNIFLIDNKAYLIDWAETRLADPMFDLSYLALCCDYDQHEELLLLNQYLNHEVNQNELMRYRLTKKINSAHLCLTCLRIYSDLISAGECGDAIAVSQKEPMCDFSEYIQRYAADSSSLEYQDFFYMAQMLIACAESIAL